MISSNDRLNQLSKKAELSINVLELYTSKKKAYLLNDNIQISLKLKYAILEDGLYNSCSPERACEPMSCLPSAS